MNWDKKIEKIVFDLHHSILQSAELAEEEDEVEILLDLISNER